MQTFTVNLTPQTTSVSWLGMLFTVRLWGRSNPIPRGNECFCRLFIRISKQSGWWEWNWKEPFKSCPIKACWSIHHSPISMTVCSTSANEEAMICLVSIFCLPCGSPQWQKNHPPLQEVSVFCWDTWNAKRKVQTQLRNTHAKTIRGGIQKASAELYFSRRRVRRGLIFWATLPPAQLERNAPFHKLNWGHAWHGNNRGRSHNFPDSGDEGGGG